MSRFDEAVRLEVVRFVRTSALLLVCVVAVFAALPPNGAATTDSSAAGSSRRACQPLRAVGPWGRVRVTVGVDRGAVSCLTARSVARTLFDGAGKHVGGSSGATSYWIVGRWRGDARMNYWIMHRCRVLAGCRTVISGTFR